MILSNVNDAKALIDILYTSNSYLVYLKITSEYRFERFCYLCTLSNVSVFGAAMHSCGCKRWRRRREAIGPSLNQQNAADLPRPFIEPPYVISSRRSLVTKCNFFSAEHTFFEELNDFATFVFYAYFFLNLESKYYYYS